MRCLIAWFALLAGLVMLGVTVAEPNRAPAPDAVADFMRLKLAHAQNILEGLATEDFVTIRKNAQELSLLSNASNWQVLQTPEYLQHSIEFRGIANSLTSAAEARNLDRAALAYVDMTMTCVNCHRHVRDVRMAQVK